LSGKQVFEEDLQADADQGYTAGYFGPAFQMRTYPLAKLAADQAHHERYHSDDGGSKKDRRADHAVTYSNRKRVDARRDSEYQQDAQVEDIRQPGNAFNSPW
jgi:hypothetical protein